MKCLGSALLPPGSRCSHRDKDERQHSAADWTSCSKPRLCELAGDWGRPRDSLLSAAFMKLLSAARPGPLRMWSTAEPWLSPVRCFSKRRALGEGHRRFRNGISAHPAKGWAEGLRDSSWFPDSPCHRISGNICEFSSILPAPMEIGTGTRLEVQTGPLQLTFICGNTLLYAR